MSTRDTLLYSHQFATRFANMMLGDLEGNDWLHRAAPGANCAAWTVGHLILGDRRITKAVFGETVVLPALPDDAFEQRFARGEAAAGAGDFGDTSGLRELFNAHRAVLVDAIGSADERVFATPLPEPTPLFRTAGEMLAFNPIHVATHMGQISTIRRSLGRPPVV